jgi:photosystem II stability/assembly factor-like uncharacterized protein
MRIISLILCFISVTNFFAQEPQWRVLPAAPVDPDSRFEDGFFIDDSTGWVINIDGKVCKTTDGGTTWDLIYSRGLNEVAFRCVNFISEEIGFIGDISRESNADSAVLYKSTDSGFTWSPVQLPQPIPDGLCGLYSLNGQFIYGVGRYYSPPIFIKSEDAGLTWQSYSLDSIANGLVDVYFTSSDTGFIVGSVNQSGIRGAIFYTTDSGENWDLVASTSLTGISCWKITFPFPSTGFVSFQGGGTDLLILKTSDAGMSWQEIIYTLPANFSAQGIGFVDDLTGWVGGFPFLDGTYKSTDGGISWQPDNFGENINRFRFLKDTLGYAIGETVYKYSITPVSNLHGELENQLPTDITLEQNYPNPFNPSTKIKFTIPNVETRHASSLQMVILKVYDVLGNEITTLVNEELSPGEYEVTFNVGTSLDLSLSSGIYFYTLRAGDFIQTKKMIYLK